MIEQLNSLIVILPFSTMLFIVLEEYEVNEGHFNNVWHASTLQCKTEIYAQIVQEIFSGQLVFSTKSSSCGFCNAQN